MNFSLNLFKRNRGASVIKLNIQNSQVNESVLKNIDNKQISMTTESLKMASKLPSDVQLNDWIAENLVDFYNKILLVVETIKSDCKCKTMCAGKLEYRWSDKDSEKYKKPAQVPAQTYFELLFQQIHKAINDVSIFPDDPNVPFPKSFKKFYEKTFTRLFRIFAHLYIHHAQHLKDKNILLHCNTIFKHFVLYNFEFDIIDKNELMPLNNLIINFLGKEYEKKLKKDVDEKKNKKEEENKKEENNSKK